MREGDIKSHSGEAALLQARELLEQARHELDDFISSRSKPPQETAASKARPTSSQLATLLHGEGDLASKAKFIENDAPPLMVEALIRQYHQRVTTPAHLRPIWSRQWDASGDGSEQMIYDAWWGSPCLYEREIWIWGNIDLDTEMTLRRETICYHWRYDHGEGQGGASTHFQMTVNAEGIVQLSSGPHYTYFPATPEGFLALFEAWERKLVR